MNQQVFDFPVTPFRAITDADLVAVMRWDEDRLLVEWGFGIRAWFNTWEHALDCVLHPLNEKVRLRIRA